MASRKSNFQGFKRASAKELNDPPLAESRCREILAYFRWGNDLRCACGYSARVRSRASLTFRCSNPITQHDFSVTAGSYLDGTRVSARKWILAAHYLAKSKNGATVEELKRVLGLTSDNTSLTVMQRLLHAINLSQEKVPSPSALFEVIVAVRRIQRRIIVVAYLEGNEVKWVHCMRLLNPDNSLYFKRIVTTIFTPGCTVYTIVNGRPGALDPSYLNRSNTTVNWVDTSVDLGKSIARICCAIIL